MSNVQRRSVLRLLGGGLTVALGCGSDGAGANGNAHGGGGGGDGVVGGGGIAGSPSAGGSGDPGGGGAGGGTTTSSWTVPEKISFVEGSESTFDLATTLPTGTPAGGVFSVDASGAGLPSGMTLSPEGLLSVGAAGVGDTEGVVFAYEV